jgi:phage portal protein BeeE
MQARALGSSGGGGGDGNPLGLGGGGGGFNIAQKRNDMGIHQEQYRHNTGWVAASIGPIAKRIARQPIRLARVSKSAPEKATAPSGRKATVAGVLVSTKAKPWEKGSEEATASALWFKQRLPGPFKTLAPSAELIDTHPILEAIDNPNPIMVRWSMMFVTVASLMLTGKAYWWVKAVKGDDGGNDGDGSPRIEIWPLPSSWVKPVHTETKLNSHYEVTPEGALEPTPVPAEQIVYFYLPDPSSLLGAQSPLQNQARAVVSDEAIAEAQRRGFANGVFPGVAVVVGRQAGLDGKPGERPALNREQRAQIITAFKQAYRGVYNHDEPIILDRLIEDVRRVTNTNREMDFQQSGAYTKERITQGFGVNPIVMGQVEGANRASSATADDHLCQSTVNPLIELISQTLSAWMNPLLAGPGERFCLFIEEARAVDPDSDRSDWEALWSAGACSKNEYRAGLRNLPPMVNGDTSIVAAGSIEIDARLATDAPEGAKPPKLIGPPDAGTEPPKPTAPLMIAPKPPEPAQNSEPPKDSSRHAVAVIDLLADMGAKRFAVEAAQAVIWSIIFGIPARKATRCVQACAVAGKLVPLEARHIAEIVNILKEPETDEGNPDEGNPADTRAALEIPVDDIRQKGEFDCGAAVSYAAALAQGLTPGDYAAFMVALDTVKEVGTMPEDIFAYFAHHGCDPLARPNRNVEFLRAELRKGRLCILPVQYFGDGDASGGEGGEVEDGHYILVNGYTRDTIKYHCPLDGPGEITPAELLGNWYDHDQSGRPFVRYVVSVGPRGNSVTDPQTNTGNTRGRRDRSKQKRKPSGSKLVDSSGHSHAADGKFGSGGSSSAKPKPEDKPSDKPEAHAPVSAGGHGTGTVADKPADLEKKAAGFLDKVKAHGAKAVEVAKKVGETMKHIAVQGSYHAMTKDLASDICDTSHDYSKIINAKGTGDYLSEHLGVSGGFAAKAASVVLSYGYTKLKEHLARRYQASLMLPNKPPKSFKDGDEVQAESVSELSIKEAAEKVHEIVCEMQTALGCPADQLPKLEDVTAWLVEKHKEDDKPAE